MSPDDDGPGALLWTLGLVLLLALSGLIYVVTVSLP